MLQQFSRAQSLASLLLFKLIGDQLRLYRWQVVVVVHQSRGVMDLQRGPGLAAGLLLAPQVLCLRVLGL